MSRALRDNPADAIFSARRSERVHFSDVGEDLTLKLAAIPHYTARAHFGLWHARMGRPDFGDQRTIFTPLVLVELDATATRVDLAAPIRVRGRAWLARVLDTRGELRGLAREGFYELSQPGRGRLGAARFVNLFTRYDADPARRRVTELPASYGLGERPERVLELPPLEEVLGATGDHEARPDPAGPPPESLAVFRDPEPLVFHYAQTDANRHVNGMEYVRLAQQAAAQALVGLAPLHELWEARARIVYRKPCFRGGYYRREACVVEENASEARVRTVISLVPAGDARAACGVSLDWRRNPRGAARTETASGP